jgi:hypothetical protein
VAGKVLGWEGVLIKSLLLDRLGLEAGNNGARGFGVRLLGTFEKANLGL